MYLSLYALLTIAGVAIAWRSNPLFSLGRTARFLAMMAVTMAILVGLIVGAVSLSQRMSPDAGGWLLGVTIVLVTMFMIWATVTASTQRPPAFAQGTRLVSIHRAHARAWLPPLFVALVVFAVLALITHGDAHEAISIFGGMIVGLATVLVFTLNLTALGMDRSLTSVEAAAWIHWTYSPDMWATWRKALVARSTRAGSSYQWRRDWPNLIVAFFIIAVAAIVLGGLAVPLARSLAVLVIIAILMAAMIEALARFEAGGPERLRRFLLKAPPETYFGDAGVFCDGVYLQWQTASSWLLSATIDERAPRGIDLEFMRIVAGSAETTQFTQTILLPPNADGDLRTLQAQLAARFPSATVALATA